MRIHITVLILVFAVLAGCKGHEGDAPPAQPEAMEPGKAEEQDEKEPPVDPQEVQRAAASEMKELARGNCALCPFDPLDDSHEGIENEYGDISQPSILSFHVHEKILPLGKHGVPELVTWLDHDDSHVRLMAYVALMLLTDTIGDAEFSWADSPVDLRDSGELEKYRRQCLEWYEENKGK